MESINHCFFMRKKISGVIQQTNVIRNCEKSWQVVQTSNLTYFNFLQIVTKLESSLEQHNQTKKLPQKPKKRKQTNKPTPKNLHTEENLFL